MISRSCSTCGIRRITLVTNPVISHEWRKDRIVITTNGARGHLQILRNGYPRDDDDRKTFQVLTSTWPIKHVHRKLQILLLIKKSSLLMMSVSDNFLLESEWFFLQNKICLFLKHDIFIYVGHSFFMTQSWTNSFNLSF